jgi:autotransporter-associated beta strand protein
MSRESVNGRRKVLFAAAGVVATLLATRAAEAATDTWTGASSANWSDPLNWTGGNAPPQNGDVLNFDGTANLASTNDITGATFAGITFAAGAGAFTLGGNSLLLTGDVTNSSAAAQTLNLAPATFTSNGVNMPTGGLVLDGSTVGVNNTGGGSLSLGQLTFGSAPLSANVSTLNVNNSATATGLTIQTKSASANVINVASGQTFTVTGTGTNGGVWIGTPNTVSGSGNIPTNVTFAGSGSFSVTGGSMYVGVGTTNIGANDRNVARVDMTGLSSFSYTGGNNFGVGWMTRPDGQLKLAGGSNTIIASQIKVGDSRKTGTDSADDNNGVTARLFLGAGTNTLQTDNVFVGRKKGAGSIEWVDANNGSLTLTAKDGVGRTNITISQMDSGSGTSTNSQMLLAGHSSNVLAATVIVGRLAATGSPTNANVMTFDRGTFDVNSLQLGVNASGGSPNGAQGTFTLGTLGDANATGVLNVNTQFLLGNDTNTATFTPTGGSPTNTFTKAIFNVNSGTANVNTDIQVVTNDSAADRAADVFTVNLAGGTLNMMGHNIGSAASPLKVFNQTGGTLSNTGVVAADAITIGAGATVTGAPTYLISSGGTLTSGVGTLTRPSGGGIVGGGAAAATVSGDIQAASGSKIAPGSGTTAGTLAFANNLILDSGSTVAFDLSNTPASGNDQVTVAGNLTASGTVNLSIAPIGAGPAVGQTYTLFTYTGTLSGNETNFSAAGIPNTRTTYSIVPTATTPGSVQLSVGGAAAKALAWVGNVNNTWDVVGASNWQDTGALQEKFYNLDSVTFDDSSTNLNDVQLVGSLVPAGVTVNASRNYTFAGSGAIGGSVALTKQGSGTLVVATNNTNTGGTDIQGGTVQVGNGGATGSLGSGNIANAGTLAFKRSDNLTFANVVSGVGSVVKLGSNTLTLTGNNTYTGPTVISAGVVSVSTVANSGTASPLGAGTADGTSLVLDGGTLRWTGAAAQSTNRGFTLGAAGGTFDSQPTVDDQPLTISGNVNYTGNGPRTLTLNANEGATVNVTQNSLNAAISDGPGGATSVVKNGPGGWSLNNSSNGFTGGTTINGGRLRAQTANALGTGPVTVNDGGQLWISTASVFSNNLSITGIGIPEGTNTENLGALRLAANGAEVAGTVTLTGNARITGRSATGSGGVISGQVTGNFALEFGGGTNTGNAGVVVLSNTANNWTGDTTVNIGTLRAGAASTPVSGGVIPHGAGAGNVVVNGGTTTATFDVNGFDVTVNGLSSSGTAANAVVTNSSGTASTLSVGDNNATASFGGAVSGNLNVAKIGTGTQTISGTNTYTGSTTASAGTLVLGSSLTTSTSLNGLGGIIVVAPGGDKTIKTGSVTASGGGTVDLKNNKMILTNNVASDVRSVIASGALSTSNPPPAGKTAGLGYAQGDDPIISGLGGSFGGESFTAADTIVKYTYLGDADLDGDVDGVDVGKWATNFTGSGGSTAKVWTQGDWDYDGDVDGVDVGKWATNFTGSGGGVLDLPGAQPAAVKILDSMGFTVVPEPGSIGLLLTAACGLATRRRRRHNAR